MDHKSFIVGGNKRCISYQSLSKALYVEPHQGLINSGSPSRSQLRRIIKGFEKAGLIKIRSANMHLILKCFLANSTKFVQNKPVTNPTHKAITSSSVPFAEKQMDYDDSVIKAAIAESSKAATPLRDNNYYIYLLSQFERFWSLYPEKKSKHQAQIAFEQLNPDVILFQQLIQALQTQINHARAMQLRGTLVPPWKYPANWLTQRCWLDERSTDALPETPHAAHTKNTRKRDTGRDLFCPPCDVIEPESNNVIQLHRHLPS